MAASSHSAGFSQGFRLLQQQQPRLDPLAPRPLPLLRSRRSPSLTHSCTRPLHRLGLSEELFGLPVLFGAATAVPVVRRCASSSSLKRQPMRGLNTVQKCFFGVTVKPFTPPPLVPLFRSSGLAVAAPLVRGRVSARTEAMYRQV